MVDYLIIGSGLAGISFAEKALEHGKSIFVIDTNLQNSSRIAGGLYNPVILKRFSSVWKAKEQLELMNQFYEIVEKKLNLKFNYQIPILRKFYSVEEQNNWFFASDKIELSPFLSTKIVTDKIKCIDSPFDYGKVIHTGYVDVGLLLDSYKNYLKTNNCFIEEIFNYSLLDINFDYIKYKDIKANHIIFAEGFGMHSNPFFKYLPLDGTKGELFIIKAPDLDLNVIINTSVFILPLENHFFKVGATYNWEDKTDTPTQVGKQELIDRIKEIITCDFEIISHFAGVRPTVKDRKPLIGTHPNYSRIHILNGLGTRGVMLGPAMAKALFDNIEFNIPLDPLVDIKRIKNR
ncbi:MAG TPA: FAD-binding oxidoreductase [Flavobacterium sp.]|nr:FAD-binding oxidoreductase [Flavobacterium sp.]